MGLGIYNPKIGFLFQSDPKISDSSPIRSEECLPKSVWPNI